MKEQDIRMAEDSPETPDLKTPDELALDMMKFIAVTTGFGRGTPTAGFGGKGPRSAEEYADALLDLFQRCRTAVRKTPQ
jgi:hypothetical protein